MAIQISKHNVGSWKKLAERGERALGTLKRVRKEGEHVVEKVLRTGETTGMALGLGFVNGYHGPITLAKIPLELLLAGALELGGYLGLAGKHSDHLNNLGDGALASWATVKGVQIGAEMKAKHAAGALAGGGQPQMTQGSASPEAIRAMVEQAVAANK